MSDPLIDLINEVRVLYQSLLQMGEELHSGSNISMGMRAVLEYLDNRGDTTVPQIGRDRRVTRQRIQVLVDELRELKLVKSVPNPASKRSPLIALTKAGSKKIHGMQAKEAERLQTRISKTRLAESAKTLAEVRVQLEKSVQK